MLTRLIEIDGSPRFVGEMVRAEAVRRVAESAISRLANECHRLRLENDRMKAALKIIDGTLDVVRGENDA